MTPERLLALLERVRRGARLAPEDAAEIEGRRALAIGGVLAREGVTILRARPIAEADLALLRAVHKGDGRRVVKAHERPVLLSLAAWGLVADGGGNRATITAWGAEVLAHHGNARGE